MVGFEVLLQGVLNKPDGATLGLFNDEAKASFEDDLPWNQAFLGKFLIILIPSICYSFLQLFKPQRSFCVGEPE